MHAPTAVPPSRFWRFDLDEPGRAKDRNRARSLVVEALAERGLTVADEIDRPTGRCTVAASHRHRVSYGWVLEAVAALPGYVEGSLAREVAP
jgi:hypothetical protein